MNYDKDKVDELTLALMWLVMWKEKEYARAWKGFDWDTLDRLSEKRYIYDPKNKARSVGVSEEGWQKAREFFAKHFGLPGDGQ